MYKLQIRAIAAEIMKELCRISDSGFSFKNFNVFMLFQNENVTKCDIVKASKYLIDNKYVHSNSLASNDWDGSITSLGIDWVEDFLNTDHTL